MQTAYSLRYARGIIMNILISDYKEELEQVKESELTLLRDSLPEAVITVLPYEEKQRSKFIEAISQADALLTAFLPIDEEIIGKAQKLKVISVMASGYNNIDIKAAKDKKVGICYVSGYCTNEVADHTMALLLALHRNLKHYEKDLEERGIWQYSTIEGGERLSDMTMAIYGFGKIGRAVAGRAGAFGLKVIVKDPFSADIESVTDSYIMEHAHIISNHMAATEENKGYFNREFFQGLKKKPIFLNLGRGITVDEEALTEALEKGYIRGAGLDVLKEEPPVLTGHPLLHRENVILTPHSAFYSDTSMKELRYRACLNLINYLSGNYSEIRDFL